MTEQFMETIEYDLVAGKDIPVIFVNPRVVFDRPQYAHFIQDAGETLGSYGWTWMSVMGYGVYKIKSNHEILHVLSYIYDALVRDPLGKGRNLKIPVAPAPPPIIPTTIKFNIINKD
jgi:hypothetical protein